MQRLLEEREKIYQEIVQLKSRLREIDHEIDLLGEEEDVLSPPKPSNHPLDAFYNLMKRGAHLKMKRNFFEFLFGRNPKIILSSIIAEAAEEANKIRMDIDDMRLSRFLEKFLTEANKQWNRELYEGKFVRLFQELEELIHNPKS